MKLYVSLLATAAVLFATAPAQAQKAKKKVVAKSATEIVISNNRSAGITQFVAATAEGKEAGVLKTALASGKNATVKLKKGSGCVLTISVAFDDEAEGTSEIDACKDKNIRFTD